MGREHPVVVVGIVLLVALGTALIPSAQARSAENAQNSGNYPESQQPSQILRVTADRGAEVFAYRIRIDGDAVLGDAADPETGDSITRNPDGTITIQGTAGAGGVDSYQITGEVLCGSLDGPGQVSLDGVPLRLEACDARSQKRQTLRMTAARNAEVFPYRIRIDGNATLGDAADPDTGDSVIRNPDGTVTIRGTAGAGGTDTYQIVGEVLCGSLDGPGRVSVGGTPLQLVSCDSPPSDGPSNGVTAFDPEISAFFCHEFAITADDAADRFTRVTLFMHDGAEITFTGDYPRRGFDQMVFGFGGRQGASWMVMDGSVPVESYGQFHGPIERVEVSNGQTTRTFENDVEGCVAAVTFGDGGTEVTVSVVGQGEKAVALHFADGTQPIPDYDQAAESVTIRGSRTFDGGNRVIESVGIATTNVEAGTVPDLIISNVGSGDDVSDGGDGGTGDGAGSRDSDGTDSATSRCGCANTPVRPAGSRPTATETRPTTYSSVA